MHRNVYYEVCYISTASFIYLVLLIMTIPTLSLGCEGYISSRDVSAVKAVIVTYFGVTT